jgi:hypothetical protein
MPLDQEDEPWEEQNLPPELQPPGAANVGTMSPGPDPSSFAPGQSTEPQAVTDEDDGAAPEEEPEPLPEFDHRWRDPFDGLCFLGKLQHTFRWMGHEFLIRTLTTDEVLEVGLLHAQYVNTLADVKAYQAAVVAACVMRVDSQPMPIPITDEATDTPLATRFQYILRHWFPPLLDVIYEEYLKLEETVNKVLDAMGKAQGWARSTRGLNTVSA